MLGNEYVADLSNSGVAVGSSIGHAIGGFFGGGSSTAAAETQQADNSVASQANDTGYQDNGWGPRSCEVDAKSFTKCLDENGGNMQTCSWYLDQLVSLQYAQCIIQDADASFAEGMPICCKSVLRHATASLF